jgi:sugar phosphate permease
MALGASMSSLPVLIVALALSGLIMSSGQPALISAMGHAVDPDDYGLATSLQQTSNQIGAVIGIGLFTAIAADAETSGPYVINYVIGMALCLAAAVICLGIVDTRRLVYYLSATALFLFLASRAVEAAKGK